MTALERDAARRGIRPPGPGTLRRYGLSAEEWLALLRGQDWRCPICRRGSSVRFVTDHDHVPRFKYLPPEERKRYVRGVLCVACNWKRVLSRMSAEEARRIALYLTAYEARRDS